MCSIPGPAVTQGLARTIEMDESATRSPPMVHRHVSCIVFQVGCWYHIPSRVVLMNVDWSFVGRLVRCWEAAQRLGEHSKTGDV